MSEELTTGSDQPIEDIKRDERYRNNFVRAAGKHELTEEEFLSTIVESVEWTVGPLYEYQRFWIAAAVSGRRVEWAQARRGSHFHIVGLSCSICGRR